jgi:hypothetical protein
MLMIKRTLLIFLLTAMMFASSAPETKNGNVFRGVIEDSQCAFNVHSDNNGHSMMLKVLKEKTGDTDEKSCTRYCIRQMAGHYVLVTKKDIYRLAEDNQTEQFAGENVVITGVVVNPSNNMLRIDFIKRDGPN